MLVKTSVACWRSLRRAVSPRWSAMRSCSALSSAEHNRVRWWLVMRWSIVAIPELVSIVALVGAWLPVSHLVLLGAPTAVVSGAFSIVVVTGWAIRTETGHLLKTDTPKLAFNLQKIAFQTIDVFTITNTFFTCLRWLNQSMMYLVDFLCQCLHTVPSLKKFPLEFLIFFT